MLWREWQMFSGFLKAEPWPDGHPSNMRFYTLLLGRQRLEPRPGVRFWQRGLVRARPQMWSEEGEGPRVLPGREGRPRALGGPTIQRVRQ